MARLGSPSEVLGTVSAPAGEQWHQVKALPHAEPTLAKWLRGGGHAEHARAGGLWGALGWCHSPLLGPPHQVCGFLVLCQIPVPILPAVFQAGPWVVGGNGTACHIPRLCPSPSCTTWSPGQTHRLPCHLSSPRVLPRPCPGVAWACSHPGWLLRCAAHHTTPAPFPAAPLWGGARDSGLAMSHPLVMSGPQWARGAPPGVGCVLSASQGGARAPCPGEHG